MSAYARSALLFARSNAREEPKPSIADTSTSCKPATLHSLPRTLDFRGSNAYQNYLRGEPGERSRKKQAPDMQSTTTLTFPPRVLPCAFIASGTGQHQPCKPSTQSQPGTVSAQSSQSSLDQNMAMSQLTMSQFSHTFDNSSTQSKSQNSILHHPHLRQQSLSNSSSTGCPSGYLRQGCSARSIANNGGSYATNPIGEYTSQATLANPLLRTPFRGQGSNYETTGTSQSNLQVPGRTRPWMNACVNALRYPSRLSFFGQSSSIDPAKDKDSPSLDDEVQVKVERSLTLHPQDNKGESKSGGFESFRKNPSETSHNTQLPKITDHFQRVRKEDASQISVKCDDEAISREHILKEMDLELQKREAKILILMKKMDETSQQFDEQSRKLEEKAKEINDKNKAIDDKLARLNQVSMDAMAKISQAGQNEAQALNDVSMKLCETHATKVSSGLVASTTPFLKDLIAKMVNDMFLSHKGKLLDEMKDEAKRVLGTRIGVVNELHQSELNLQEPRSENVPYHFERPISESQKDDAPQLEKAPPHQGRPSLIPSLIDMTMRGARSLRSKRNASTISPNTQSTEAIKIRSPIMTRRSKRLKQHAATLSPMPNTTSSCVTPCTKDTSWKDSWRSSTLPAKLDQKRRVTIEKSKIEPSVDPQTNGSLWQTSDNEWMADPKPKRRRIHPNQDRLLGETERNGLLRVSHKEHSRVDQSVNRQDHCDSTSPTESMPSFKGGQRRSYRRKRRSLVSLFDDAFDFL